MRFSVGDYERLVYFNCEGAQLAASGDALLCLGLLPAMELNVDLRIEAGVDGGLIKNANEIQRLLCKWYPGYQPVQVQADTLRRRYPEGRGTGLFFSGGVDSSYSLAEENEGLSALVTIIGADVAPEDLPRAKRLRSIAVDVAAEYQLKPIIVTSNIRDVSDRMIGWVEYHGAFLAAVRHMLACDLEKQLVASSADNSSWNRRWGSHPALDKLWGTAGAQIEHHGLVDRLSKIDRIAKEPVLMEHLRVCNREYEHCGACDSCRFMLTALDLLDLRSLSPTYSHLGSAGSTLRVTGEGSLSDLTRMRQVAVARERDAVVAAIDSALAKYGRKKRFYRSIPVDELNRRFKRFKRQRRLERAVRKVNK
ncbi:MAG: hypothetical protein AAF724_03320 [Pseudomonadota bacterium]